MYIEDYKNGDYWGGYIAQPEYMKGKLIEMIDNALDAGIYILIAWHIHNDPTNFTTEALAFFSSEDDRSIPVIDCIEKHLHRS